MLPKLIIILVLLLILASLFSGMYFMLRDRGQSTRNVKALTIRITLSVLLFLLVILAYLTGLIHPHGLNTP